MTRKKQSVAQIAGAAARAATTEALKNADDGLEVTLGADEDAAELDALESLSELGEGQEYTYVVMCLSPLDKRGRVETVTRDALAELPDYLRDRYGPGKYSVQAKGPRGYVRGSHRIIAISTLARPPAGGPSASGAAAGGEWERWLEREARGAEARRLEQREDQKFMMQMIVTAMGGNRGESLSDLVQALVAMKTLTGEGGSSNTEKVLEVLTRGMEIGAKANGKEPETVLGVIRETIRDLTNSPIGQSVMDRIANRTAAPAQSAAAAPQPQLVRVPYQGPSAAPAGAPPATLASAPAGDDPMMPLLNKLADELLEYAGNGTDPGLAAEALVAKVPRMVRAMVTAEQLKAWLTAPDWWEHLKAFRPALEPYMAFCDDVRQALYGLLVQSPAPEETVQ